MNNLPSEQLIITFDGGEGTGTTTASRGVAARLGLRLLNSGQLYRGMTRICLDHGIDVKDPQNVPRISDIAHKEIHRITVSSESAYLDGVVIAGERFYHPLMGKLTPSVAKIPEVRKLFHPLQRQCLTEKGLVAEGRDMGSVIFPHAIVKIFLTAPIRVRGERRLQQFRKSGNLTITLDEVIANIEERDREDVERHCSPLVCPEGGFTIDTSISNEDATIGIVSNIWFGRVGNGKLQSVA